MKFALTTVSEVVNLIDEITDMLLSIYILL